MEPFCRYVGPQPSARLCLGCLERQVEGTGLAGGDGPLLRPGPWSPAPFCMPVGSGLHANSGIGILFGSLSLSGHTLNLLLIVALVVLLVLALIFRPLLFASVDPDIRPGPRGVPIRLLDFVYLLLLAATTAVSIQSMGFLLAFALLSAPCRRRDKFAATQGSPSWWPCFEVLWNHLGQPAHSIFRSLEEDSRGILHRVLVSDSLWRGTCVESAEENDPRTKNIPATAKERSQIEAPIQSSAELFSWSEGTLSVSDHPLVGLG